MNQKILQITLLLWILVPAVLFTQSLNEVTIHGVVSDSLSGQPLGRVLVEVISETDTTERASALTASDGKYTLVMLTRTKILPDECFLFQNYPNPFNPTTVIQFQVADVSDVKLVIYNTLGQKIRILVNRQLPRNSYVVEWDGTNDGGEGVAAGIYFYQIHMKEYNQTRKMVLLDGYVGNSASPYRSSRPGDGIPGRAESFNVTIRATSESVKPFVKREVAISLSSLQYNISLESLPRLFDLNCLRVSEIDHNGMVYIGGLPKAIDGEITGSEMLVANNDRLMTRDSTAVNPSGSFAAMKLAANFEDLLSVSLYRDGDPLSAPEELTVPETAAPVVLDSKPTNGDKDIIVDAVIQIYFSEPIETATVNPNSFYVTDSIGNRVPGVISFGEGNTVAYLDPTHLLAYVSDYTIVVTTEVVDLQGLHLEQVYSATFTTGSPSSQSTIIHVPGDVSTIQGGIDLSNDGDTVLVADGLYYENIRFRGKAITVASHFMLDGDTSHISHTVIDGSQPNNPDSGSVVYFVSGEDTNSVLMGFTITGGTGTKYTITHNQHTGGGVFIWTSGKIEYNKIIDNHLANAGGIYTHAAGVFVYPDGHAVVRNNLISGNTINAWWGGAAGTVMVCNDTSTIIFDKNILTDNIYNANGGLCSGGAVIGGGPGWNGRIVFSNNLVLRNQAVSTYANNGLAGGLYVESASPEIFNNIIAGNRTSGRGGGIFVGTNGNQDPGNPIIVNNTIINNQARYGGGLYNDWTTNNPFIMNTIFWGNQASQQGNEIYRSYGNITVVYSDIKDTLWTGEGNISRDPMLRGDNYQLSDSSRCIGSGIGQYLFRSVTRYCPAAGFLGNPRPDPAGSSPDMGACESSLSSPVVLPPRVLYSQPADGDEGVSIDVVIMVYFSEPIDTTRVTWENFHLDSAGHHLLIRKIGFLDGGTIAYLDPLDPLKYSSSYTITVTTDVVNLQGLHLESEYNAMFNTENPEPKWIIYNTSNSGLPSNNIICLTMDSHHIKWIGTSMGGLTKYDGNDWTVYNSSFGLPDTIWAVTVDKNNNIWSGSPDNGVARYNGKNWITYNSSNSGLPINRVRSITSDINNDIWIGTGYDGYLGLYGGLAMYDGINWTVYNSINSSLPNREIFCLNIDSNNEKWIGTGGGVVKFNGNYWTVYNTSNSPLPDNRVFSIAIDDNDHKWIGTYNGLAKYDGANWTVFNTLNSGLPDNWVKSILIDRNSAKWIGTANGLVKFDETTWTAYNNTNSSLPYNEVTSVAIDDNNNIWIGTGNGLAVFNENGVVLP